MLTESWIITGKCEAGVSAIIKDAFEQYRRLEFNKLQPKVDKANHYEVKHTEDPKHSKNTSCQFGKRQHQK